MKLSVTKVLALVALGAIPLAGCNTIKGLLGDKEAPTTEAEPTTEATETAPPASAPAETAAPDVSAAPSAEVPAIVAVNAADIKRFDDEQQLEAPADTKVKDKASTIIKEPPNGAVVALLQPGTEVKALAQREEFTLVAFQNPAKPDETLMGWTQADAVEPVAPATAPSASSAAPSEPCVPGFTKVFVGVTERCEVVCTDNAGCPTGQNCVGSAKASNAGVPGGPVKFCAVRAAAPPPAPTSPRRKPPEPPKEEKKKKTKAKKKAND